MKATIISFEGVDGCGKSTVSKIVSRRIHDSRYVHFPSDMNEYGRHLNLYMDGKVDVDVSSLVKYFLLDMSYVVTKYVSRLGGTWIFDRYIHSTLVYQPLIGGMSQSSIKYLSRGIGLRTPDLTIYLRVDIDTAVSRLRSRSDKNLFDKDVSLLESVISGYDDLAEKGEIIAVDATRKLDDVVSDCMKLIEEGVTYG